MHAAPVNPRCPQPPIRVPARRFCRLQRAGRDARHLTTYDKCKTGLSLSGDWKAAAMGQLLVTLIVPPIIGVVTYLVVRLIWEQDENGAGEVARRRDPSAVTPAEGTTTDA